MSKSEGIATDAEAGLASLLRQARELASLITAGVAASPDAAEHHDRLRSVSDRLTRSVIQPLTKALPEVTGNQIAHRDQAAQREGHADQKIKGAEVRETSAVGQALLGLAREATRLRALTGVVELQEATAALQDLACRWPSNEGDDDAARRLAGFREIMASLPSGIQSETDGPYLATNAENVTDWLGCALPSTPQMALCRCGQSKLGPICDGTHADIGFRSEKAPDRVQDRRDAYVGQQLTVFDNRGICQHSGFCSDRLATAFRVSQEPFVAPSGGRMDEIIRAVRDCPSGALSYAVDGVEARDEVDYHRQRDATIQVTKDGPYRVTGAIPLTDADGQPEPLNAGASREHYALCRCGHSQNKPFCSGMHWYVGFKDPLPDPTRTPSMFEWCGGLPALTRMTRRFYEKYVPEDPLLAPLFATMSTDHPQRVAKWLGEVFGGPSCYSEEYGGYTRMISQHLGKCLTEEWRARWVALLLTSAHEVGMPNDPEFAAAFQSYIEWGSRLAVENSQTTSHPPEHMPMPHWDWSTGAGVPGGRVSALAAPTDQDEPLVLLPAADEPVRFDTHIKPLFRPRDRRSMTFAFDLWAYQDVRSNAEAILERLRNGTMPCDGAWPAEKIQAFERWSATGMSE